MPVRNAKRSKGRWASADAYQPMDRTTVSREWHKQALTDAAIRDMPLHALRHTAAAAWLAAGNSLAIFMSNGNSDTPISALLSTTTDMYSGTSSRPGPVPTEEAIARAAAQALSSGFSRADASVFRQKAARNMTAHGCDPSNRRHRCSVSRTVEFRGYCRDGSVGRDVPEAMQHGPARATPRDLRRQSEAALVASESYDGIRPVPRRHRPRRVKPRATEPRRWAKEVPALDRERHPHANTRRNARKL